MKSAPDEKGHNGHVAEKPNERDAAVAHQAERFRAVLEIGAALSSARDLDELLQLVMDRLTALLKAEASTLFLHDACRRELWSKVLKGSALKEIRIADRSGIAGHVLQTGRPLVLADAYDDSRFNPEIDRSSGFRTRSIVAAPLRHVSGRILGVLEVLHRKVNAFGEEDRALLEMVATQIAAALDNVLLLDELRAQNEKLLKAGEDLTQAVRDLDLLYEVEQAISSSEQQADLLDRILEKAIAATGAGGGSILLAEEEKGELFFKSVRGDKSGELLSMSLRPGQGIAGYVAQTGEVVRVAHAEDCKHYDRSIARKLGVAVEAVLCVPIEGDVGVLGSLELLNKPGGFDEGDERLAILLAGQTGRAILLRKAREEGERKARLATIGQMLSGVLHDLRTPMTIISGYVQMMVSEDDPAERAKMSDIIQRQFEHINAMTKETLAFARGERALLLRKVYLQHFVREVEDYLRADFQRTNVELKVQASYTGVARFDENKLKRVVYNIARNAVQAMPDGGRFVFTVDKDGDQLLLRFQDNGPGIPPEIADKLFESFVTARKKDGTGLGLAIVKKIAEEHGGSVSCRSRPGRGTTFEVRIPLGLPAS